MIAAVLSPCPIVNVTGYPVKFSTPTVQLFTS